MDFEKAVFNLVEGHCFVARKVWIGVFHLAGEYSEVGKFKYLREFGISMCSFVLLVSFYSLHFFRLRILPFSRILGTTELLISRMHCICKSTSSKACLDFFEKRNPSVKESRLSKLRFFEFHLFSWSY